MFSSKRFILIAISFIASALFFGCGTGGGSTNVTSVATYGVNISSSLLKDGQTYTVQVTADDNDTMVYATCTVVGTVCNVNIPQANFIAGENQVNVIVMQNKALIAAGEIDPSYYLSSNGSPTIYLNELTTGDYIRDVLQNITDNAIIHGSINDEIVNQFDLNASDPKLYQTLPTYAYAMFMNAQAPTNVENDGLYLTWFALFGSTSDSNATTVTSSTSSTQSSTSSATSIVSQALTSVTSLLKTGVASTSASGTAANPTPQTAQAIVQMSSLANGATAKSPDAWIVQYTPNINVAATNITARLNSDKPNPTNEAQTGAKIAQSVIGIGCKGLDIAFPGFGGLLQAITGGIFDWFSGPQEDPNKPLIDAIGKVEDAVKDVTVNIQQASFIQIDTDFKKALTEYNNKVIDINNTGTQYFSILNNNKALIPANPSADYVNAQLIDAYLDTLIPGSKEYKDEIYTINGWFNGNSGNDNLKSNIDKLTSDDYINQINSQLKTRLDSQSALVNPAKNIDVNGSSTNIIAFRKGAIAQSLALQDKAVKAIDRTRNQQLAAAYLRYASKYKDQFKTITSSIPDFGKDYKTSVDAINTYYSNTETGFAAKMAVYRNSIIASLYSGSDGYFDKTLFDINKDTNKSACYITYWDGKNIGYTYKTSNKITSSYINDVANTCDGLIKNLGTSANPRYACKTSYLAIGASYVGSGVESYGTPDMTQLTYISGMKASNGQRPAMFASYYANQNDPLINALYVLYFSDLGQDYSSDNGGGVYGKNGNSGGIYAGPTFYFQYSSFYGSYHYYGGQLVVYDQRPDGATMHEYVARAYDHANYSYGYTSHVITGIIGCIASDCVIYTQTNAQVTIGYDDGASITLTQAPSSWKNDSGITDMLKLDYNASKKPLMPSGDWTSKCDVNSAIYSSGWLHARCKYNSAAGGDMVWSNLNFGRDCIGKSVTVKSDNTLMCQ